MYKLRYLLDWISPFSLAVKSVVITAIITGVLSSFYFWHTSEVKIAVTKAETALIKKYDKQSALLQQRSNKTSASLKDQQQKTQKEKDAKVKQLNTDFDLFITSLLNRPERPEISSNNPRDSSNPESTKGTTGRELYRSDAEFLARYSTKTEQLKIELLACYKQYEDVKGKLDKFRSNNPDK